MKFVALLLVFVPLIISIFNSFFITVMPVYAATTPDLAQAASFGILSSTYSNTVGGTTINGDLGYTTGPAFAPTVNGTTHIADGTYNQAGIDQGSALSALASQSCTHTFPAGPVDLATDTSHGPIGVYTPGVYCTASSSAASIGTGGITLSGNGTYIFRIDGAFTTVSSSVVTLSGASACDVFWTPTSATTLGASSTIVGTVIDNSGITIGSTVTWTGRALAFGGTVSTTTDTITVPTCDPIVTSTPSPTPSPTATPTPTLTPTPTTSPASSSTSSITTSSSSSNSSSSSTGGSVICPTFTYVTPIIIESRRVDADSIFIDWGPYSGIETFNIRYGPTNSNWLYNYDFRGFSATINNLAFNQPIWIQVAARDGCSLGVYGEAVFVGGPRLPNAGVATFN